MILGGIIGASLAALGLIFFGNSMEDSILSRIIVYGSIFLAAIVVIIAQHVIKKSKSNSFKKFKEFKTEEKDERNIKLREKAAYFALNAMSVVTGGAILAFFILDNDDFFAVLLALLGVLVGNGLIYLAALWYYGKKM